MSPWAAGSEDNTVRLWDLTGQCKQVISFPGCVWTLAFLPSGDFVAGVSDSKAYVFSGDEVRHAPAAMIQTFTAAVAEFQASAAPEKKGAGLLLAPLHTIYTVAKCAFVW
jgi:WD40 repeat protein